MNRLARVVVRGFSTTVPITPSRLSQTQINRKLGIVDTPSLNREWSRIYRDQLQHRIAPNMEQVPFENVYLERNEVQTRILRLLHQSELVNIRNFSFKQDLRTDLDLDSLSITALVTEIEQEFTIVFEDRVFESVQRLEDLVKLICRDEMAF